MKKGNIVLLAAGYLAGLAVALRFNKKSHEDFQKELAETPEKYKTFGKSFMDIHKNLFETIETSLFSEENKKRVEEYKQKFLTELESFQDEAEIKLKEWKLQWMGTRDEIETELRNIYARRVELMEQAREKGISLFDDAKDEGKDIMEEGKRIANKIFDEAKHKLDKWYENIKKHIK